MLQGPLSPRPFQLSPENTNASLAGELQALMLYPAETSKPAASDLNAFREGNSSSEVTLFPGQTGLSSLTSCRAHMGEG